LAELLGWLEASALGQAMRSSGVWSYGVVNLTHILGVATLFGSILALDLRLLGLWRGVALSALAAPTVPLAAIGFAVAIASGTAMISTNGTEYIGNPFVPIKFAAIGVGLLNVLALSSFSAWRERATREPDSHERKALAAFGGVSLAAWTAAITAGRMIGYW
jgi:hypothetical protein